MWKLVDEYFEEFQVVDKDEKRAFVNLLSTLLTRVSKFWLEKIMRPLSRELDLPERAACRCCKRNRALRRCDHDLIIYSHYDDESTAKVKVDLFSGPPSVSINVACQEDSDIDRFKRYYTLLLERYNELSCCRCCPISTDLIQDIEDHIDETEHTISTMLYIIDHAASNDVENSDEDETVV